MLIALRTTDGATVWANPDSIAMARLYPASSEEHESIVAVSLPDFASLTVYASEFAKVLDWFEAEVALAANYGRLVSELRAEREGLL